jgi:hypothetical protein
VSCSVKHYERGLYIAHAEQPAASLTSPAAALSLHIPLPRPTLSPERSYSSSTASRAALSVPTTAAFCTRTVPLLPRQPVSSCIHTVIDKIGRASSQFSNGVVKPVLSQDLVNADELPLGMWGELQCSRATRQTELGSSLTMAWRVTDDAFEIETGDDVEHAGIAGVVLLLARRARTLMPSQGSPRPYASSCAFAQYDQCKSPSDSLDSSSFVALLNGACLIQHQKRPEWQKPDSGKQDWSFPYDARGSHSAPVRSRSSSASGPDNRRDWAASGVSGYTCAVEQGHEDLQTMALSR